MSDIRPVTAGPTLDGYYQQLINQIHILRLAINPNATGQGGDLAEKTQMLVHELVDELDELQRVAVPFMIALRQSLPSAAAIRAGQQNVIPNAGLLLVEDPPYEARACPCLFRK